MDRFAHMATRFLAWIGRGMFAMWQACRRFWGWLTRFVSHGADERVASWLDQYTLQAGPPLVRTRAFLLRLFQPPHNMKVKITLSTLLWLLALLLKVLMGGRIASFMLLGMTLCWFGDALLMRYPPVSRWVRQYFLWGMSAFALAQIFYLSALWQLYFAAASQTHWVLFSALAATEGTALIILSRTVLPNRRQPLPLRLGALAYALLIGAMAGFSLAVCIATVGRGWAVMLGGLLFFTSDMLIALMDFGGLRTPYREVSIWSTYVPAQMCLIIGAALLAQGL